MDHNGKVFILPLDSHTTSLAYHIATSSAFYDAKRYSINQVYDIENYRASCSASTELTFNIVTSSASATQGLRLLKEDAQVVQLIAKVIRDCKISLSSVELQMSHQLLVEAILVHFGVPFDQIATVARQIQEKLRCYPKGVIPTFNGIADPESLKLFWMLINDVPCTLKMMRDRLNNLADWNINGATTSTADRAFTELENIAQNLLGSDDLEGLPPILINLSLAFENYETYSGSSFKFIQRFNEEKE